MQDLIRILPAWILIRRICRDDVDLVCIMFDAVQNCFRKRAVIPAQLIVPSTWIILAPARWWMTSYFSLWSSSRMSCCSDSVGFSRSHSSMISKTLIGIFPLDFLICAVIACHLQFEEQIRKTNIFRLVALFTGFHPERACHIGLPLPVAPVIKRFLCSTMYSQVASRSISGRFSFRPEV